MNPQIEAHALLIQADRTMLRVLDAVSLGETTLDAPDVRAWAEYRRDLRVIAAGGSGPLPARPPFPANT